jgi:exodeoxyribonuclease VII small subunit
MAKKKQDTQDQVANMPFDKALARLEEIVGEMENNNLPLEKAMEAYEEGVYLVKHCRDKITEAEAKVEMLERDNSKSAQGNDSTGRGGKNSRVKKKQVEISEENDEPVVSDKVQGTLLDFD